MKQIFGTYGCDTLMDTVSGIMKALMTNPLALHCSITGSAVVENSFERLKLSSVICGKVSLFRFIYNVFHVTYLLSVGDSLDLYISVNQLFNCFQQKRYQTDWTKAFARVQF